MSAAESKPAAPAPLTGKTIFLTGATGFLGGAIAHRLAREGAIIRALIRNPERAGYIRELPGMTLITGDLNQPDSYRIALTGADIVIHVAAALGGPLEQQLVINRDGTRGLAEAAAAAGVKRFVHVSTISVYGYSNTRDVTEATPPNPSHDPYGISKLAAEVALREVAAAHGMAYSIIRPGMIYGPRSGMWTGNMFKVSRRFTLFVGSGQGSSYPIHVDDVVDLTLLLATHPAAVGEVFNCAPDPSPTWRDFLGGYARLDGHTRWIGIPPLVLAPVVAVLARFAPAGPLRDLPELLRFSQRSITYRTTKARERLGWQAQVELQAGIDGCADWLREQGWLTRR